jgi:hypothetical protein
MKYSALVLILALAQASAWSTPTRSSLRQLGQKTVALAPQQRKIKVAGDMKMEGAFSFVVLRHFACRCAAIGLRSTLGVMRLPLLDSWCCFELDVMTGTPPRPLSAANVFSGYLLVAFVGL